MAQALIVALEAGLRLLGTKEANKPLQMAEQLRHLKEAWHEEYNRGPDLRDLAVIGDIELKLRLLADSFATAVGQTNP